MFKRLYDRRWEPRGLLEPLGARDLSYRKLCATRHAFERACMQTLQRQSSMSPEQMQHFLLRIPNKGIGTPQRPETAAACIRNMLQRNIGSRQASPQLTIDPTGLRTRPYGLRYRDEYRVRPGLHVLEGDFHPSGGGGPSEDIRLYDKNCSFPSLFYTISPRSFKFRVNETRDAEGLRLNDVLVA